MEESNKEIETRKENKYITNIINQIFEQIDNQGQSEKADEEKQNYEQLNTDTNLSHEYKKSQSNTR